MAGVLLHFIVVLIYLSTAATADYVKAIQYETSSTCSGPVYSTLAKLGDLGVADGCEAIGAGVYSKYFCNNSSSLVSNKYYSPSCSGSPFESTPITSIAFGCSTASATSSVSFTCEYGTFSVSSFSFVRTTYASTIPCSGYSSVPPTSIIESPLDTCITYANNGLKYSYDSPSGNVLQTLFTTPGCDAGSGGNPTVSGSVGCVTSTSETTVTSCTAAVSPSPTPTPSSTPSPSISPSNLPVIKQTYEKKVSYYGSSTCSTPPYSSYVVTNFQSCLSSPSSGLSHLRICSNDGQRHVQYNFNNLDCSGQPISVLNSTYGCVSDIYGGSYLYSCLSGEFEPPSNSLVIKTFQKSQTCESTTRPVSTEVGNVVYTVYPVDTCLKTSSGSSLTSCSSSVATITQFNSNFECNGTPDVITTAPVGECNISSVNVADTFIALCPGLPSPSPITTVSPTPTPTLSRGASPSTTPSFFASPTPVNPSLSRYSLVTTCELVAYRFKKDVTEEDDCIIDAKYKPIMSILVYNPLNGLVTIKQRGLTKSNSVFDIALISGVNTRSSTATWVSLGNISCVTFDNPSGYCDISFRGSQNITVWTSYYKLTDTVSARNTNANGGTLGGGIVGGLILVLLILAVLHSLRVINVPCFNSCCDNRSRGKNLTMTPEVVTMNNFANVVPVIQPQPLPLQPQPPPLQPQPQRVQAVAMMQPKAVHFSQTTISHPQSYPTAPQQPVQPYGNYPSIPSPQRVGNASRV